MYFITTINVNILANSIQLSYSLTASISSADLGIGWKKSIYILHYNDYLQVLCNKKSIDCTPLFGIYWFTSFSRISDIGHITCIKDGQV